MKKPTTDTELIDMIDARRPMYTGRSITCLRAFIAGWMVGADLVPDAMRMLGRFEESLQQKYELSKAIPWDRILLLYARDEADAYEKFFEQFKQFVQQETGGRF